MLKHLAPLVLLLAACGGGGSGDDEGGEHAYLLSSLVLGDESESYVAVLDNLAAQTIDKTKTTAFSGAADVWVHDGQVYVTDSENLTITRYTVDGRKLVAHETIGFGDYGLTDFGFWTNVFVATDKAYFLHGSAEYIVWNPRTMQITGTIPLPPQAAHGELALQPGYADRAAIVRNGRAYLPLYWTDPDTYFAYAQDSVIAVLDIATDKVVDMIQAPCPGLDYASADAAGNLFFSAWVYAPGAAAVLAQPATCAFEIPADGSAPHVAFQIADLTDGREGGAVRFLSNGRAMLSVFHDERFTIDDKTNVSDVTFGPNWRFWSFDATQSPLGTGAAPIAAFDWSSGAQYTYDIANQPYMLVAAGDYSATTVYQLDGTTPTPAFTVDGWSLRLFQVR